MVGVTWMKVEIAPPYGVSNPLSKWRWKVGFPTMELTKLRGTWRHTSSGWQTRDCRAAVQLYVGVAAGCGLSFAGVGVFVAKGAKAERGRCSSRVMLRIAASGLRSVGG